VCVHLRRLLLKLSGLRRISEPAHNFNMFKLTDKQANCMYFIVDESMSKRFLWEKDEIQPVFSLGNQVHEHTCNKILDVDCVLSSFAHTFASDSHHFSEWNVLDQFLYTWLKDQIIYIYIYGIFQLLLSKCWNR
jgi:hypothetical protein